ncbi:ATP-binding cassette domain-containing protein [Sediminicoccus sp. KRV36]|uniref:ATP-binding cassette domain-containing protein n=1 Tax=Sediminicoccus sp. KRV36 TaxID=3133721 RepID=UPI00200CBDBB|nr:ATP-binding cassette domain-containing protein [Sediminicoccus rosea]UPY38937.1 ATP-binding cassette domain-containing protein [Sediminicoccus rosea]
MPVALSLEGVRAGHRGFVLEIAALTLHRGEAVALHGPSGAGKSTLLDLLALARAPEAAHSFMLMPREAAPLDLRALWAAGEDGAITDARARHYGYVLQQGGLLPFLDVRANIEMPLALLGRSAVGRVRALAVRLEIKDLLHRMPATLSVGQRQRVAIARALVHMPDIVLADEPTASVHPGMADTVMALLREEASAAGAALLLATHDPERAARQGFRLLQLIPDPGGAARSVLPA